MPDLPDLADLYWARAQRIPRYLGCDLILRHTALAGLLGPPDQPGNPAA